MAAAVARIETTAITTVYRLQKSPCVFFKTQITAPRAADAPKAACLAGQRAVIASCSERALAPDVPFVLDSVSSPIASAIRALAIAEAQTHAVGFRRHI